MLVEFSQEIRQLENRAIRTLFVIVLADFSSLKSENHEAVRSTARVVIALLTTLGERLRDRTEMVYRLLPTQSPVAAAIEAKIRHVNLRVECSKAQLAELDSIDASCQRELVDAGHRELARVVSLILDVFEYEDHYVLAEIAKSRGSEGRDVARSVSVNTVRSSTSLGPITGPSARFSGN